MKTDWKGAAHTQIEARAGKQTAVKSQSLKPESKAELRDFPGGPVVKNLPSNGEDVGLIPGWGTKIPHASGQLSWHAATAESRHSRASALQQEKPLYHNKGLEKPKKRRNFAETQENLGFQH